MAIYRYVRTNNIPVIIFAESETGYFTHIIDSNDSKRYDCDDNTMRVATCGISPKTIARNWQGLTNAIATTNNFITCTGSYGSAMYPGFSPYTASLGSITIKDEHGSHVGTQDCENEKCYYSSSNSGCVGVKHTSTDYGWIFKGWRVTAPFSGYEIPSANYDSRYVNGQHIWEVSNPSEDDLNNALIIYDITTSSAITVEAIYEELPKWTVSFNLNGGTGDTPSVETYQGDAVIIPDYRPTRDGYKFLGWSLSQNATTAEYVGGDEFTPDGDIVLYAVWEESDEPDEPITPGGGDSSTKGFIRRSSKSDYLIFSITTGNLVYN